MKPWWVKHPSMASKPKPATYKVVVTLEVKRAGHLPRSRVIGTSAIDERTVKNLAGLA
jgi:hypothetical protein